MLLPAAAVRLLSGLRAVTMWFRRAAGAFATISIHQLSLLKGNVKTLDGGSDELHNVQLSWWGQVGVWESPTAE